MNSDLVYKKKYLKYKSKYIALQRQLYAQEGGWRPSFTTFSFKSKLGIYLFFIYNTDKYYEMLDDMKLLKEIYFKDGGKEISEHLGEGCYYVERKTNIIDSGTKGEGRISITFNKSFTLKSCKGGKDIPFKGVEFSDKNVSFDSLNEILNAISSNVPPIVPSITHYFIVDFNGLKYNRISCLFKMPDPSSSYVRLPPFAPLPAPSAPPQQFAPAYGASPVPSAPPQLNFIPKPVASSPQGLISDQLTLLKQKYQGFTDEEWQQAWRQSGLKPEEYVQNMLSQPIA